MHSIRDRVNHEFGMVTVRKRLFQRRDAFNQSVNLTARGRSETRIPPLNTQKGLHF